MINLIYKDITTVPINSIIAQGVNCSYAMGSGVALAIMTKWPCVREIYMDTSPRLGIACIIEVESEIYVANCYTQQTCGNDGKRYASADAIQSSLSTVYEYAQEHKLDVCLPQIGAGLGGLNWEKEVFPIIEDLDDSFKSITTNLYMWK